ncbi:trehalose-6-phosphate synthase [Tsukamurella sp. 8F]|uniref:alpha,alpha-trehalose-phosphate synthase (UDP-forming) n=1 Tax=unclassified Tsukamurella TaxID=2633480 RepID=UPI0023B949A5|nr:MULTISPECIES: trehalose-6-phosphate synthase [unclassified Tsukamurella]MDF0528325.1 trehalose-6-phosphate synthase [Tsukamurella sp. 8J]MDF0586150.1 trehalose-6-phosphate synthase [Tsukamurella sp. 8F]
MTDSAASGDFAPSGEAAPSSDAADFVVVANRLPVDVVRDADGTLTWKQSPGGLVTALKPILAARQGAWVGWPGAPDVGDGPVVGDGMTLVPVQLSQQEVNEHYEGFSNGSLWPLYHDVIVKPEYHREWWNTYVDVNRRFAEATASVAAEGATVWVQDYQLQLVPRMLRMLRPDLRIGFFLHIPFPPVELFMQMPWRTEIIEGILGADLVGFHLAGGAQNFLYLAKRLCGYNTSRGQVGVRSRFGVVSVGFRSVRVGAFPISIDSAELDRTARTAETKARAKRLRRELGDPAKVMLGVDRLDYTKGIDVRLRAIGELYAEGRLDPAEHVFVQLATPSRERVESYRTMRDDIERQVGRINGEYGRVGHPAVHYIHRPVPRDELLAFFSAADVMLVTPLRDGMNLVAKEYLACRPDGGGALVLSEFTGAAAELKQAYQCNPHDLDGVKNAIDDAVHQDREEGRKRIRAMRRQVLQYDVDLWARSFLDTLSGHIDTVRDTGDGQ